MHIRYKDEIFEGIKLNMDNGYPWHDDNQRLKYYKKIEKEDPTKFFETLKQETDDLLHVKVSKSLIFGILTILFLIAGIVITIFCKGCEFGIGFILYSLVAFIGYRLYRRQAKRNYKKKKIIKKYFFDS